MPDLEILLRHLSLPGLSRQSRRAASSSFVGKRTMQHRYWVYLMASKRNGTLYVGVTNDLSRRVFEHKEKIFSGFTAKYDVNLLVWYEEHRYINNAIQREKNIKHWPRAWKLKLIEEFNPEWADLDLMLV